MKKITLVVGTLQFFVFGLLIFLNSEINLYLIGYDPPWLRNLISDNMFYFNGFLCLSSLMFIRISSHDHRSLKKKPHSFLFFLILGFILSSAMLIAWVATLVLNKRITPDAVSSITLLLGISSLILSFVWIYSLVKYIHQKTEP